MEKLLLVFFITLLSCIKVKPSPFDTSQNTAANLLYVVNYESNTVTFFNATTGAYANGTLANSSFATGSNTLELALSPSANRVYIVGMIPAKITFLNALEGYSF